jgi:hypothetical protein
MGSNMSSCGFAGQGCSSSSPCCSGTTCVNGAGQLCAGGDAGCVCMAPIT